jgi:hypothetical protein
LSDFQRPLVLHALLGVQVKTTFLGSKREHRGNAGHRGAERV